MKLITYLFLILFACISNAQIPRPLQDLTTLAAPASGDLAYIVDVSASNASRKLTLGALQSWWSIATTQITGTLPIASGGTGATSAGAARTALGLDIGTNVQAFDSCLQDIADLADPGADKLIGWDDSVGECAYFDIGGGGGGSGTVTHTSGALTENALIIGNGSDDVKPLASLGIDTYVLHGNPSGPPFFGLVSLTNSVDGELPVGNGGTGAGDAASARSNLGAAGLTSTETLTNKTLGTATAIDLGSDATGDLYYRNSGGDLARLGIGSSGQVLTVDTGLPTWAAGGGGADVSGLGGLYGDGSDGDLTISSGITTISAANYVAYDDVTISGTATLKADGRAIYIDVLDLTAATANAINENGANASGVTAGVSLANNGRQTPAVGASTAGGASSNTNGTQATGVTPQAYNLTSSSATYGTSGAGGAGGASSPRTGGIQSTVGASVNGQPVMSPPADPGVIGAWIRASGPNGVSAMSLVSGAVNSGSTGGGGGAGSLTQAGTQGGGGGAAAGPLLVYARSIVVDSSTPACVLSASGGAGGNSANATNTNTAAGGGGGGGHGGLLIVVTDSITATDATTSVADALCADSGAGGNAGTSNGTASDGAGGYSGRSGRVILHVRGTGQTYYASASAGTAPSGRTGGAAVQSRVALTVD